MDKSTTTADHRKLCGILRQFRTAAQLSQRELADLLHRPQSFVSKYETGERRLDLIELSDVCQALGTDLFELVKRFERARGNSKDGR